MYRRKNSYWRFGKALVVFTIVGLLWQNYGRMVMADDSRLSEEKSGTYESEMTEEAEIFICTYSEDIYEISGTLEILQEGKPGRETIMEVKGEITKNRDNNNMAQYNTKEHGDPTILTVYMNEQIYGFYSSYKIEKSSKSGKEQIFMYGFLEGYYDGENVCST